MAKRERKSKQAKKMLRRFAAESKRPRTRLRGKGHEWMTRYGER